MKTALEYAEDSLKADPEVVKIAVVQKGCALGHAGESLNSDPEVVRIAVAKNGIALRYAAELLKADPEVVKIVVAKDGLAGTGTCSRVTEGRLRGGEDCCGQQGICTARCSSVTEERAK